MAVRVDRAFPLGSTSQESARARLRTRAVLATFSLHPLRGRAPRVRESRERCWSARGSSAGHLALHVDKHAEPGSGACRPAAAQGRCEETLPKLLCHVESRHRSCRWGRGHADDETWRSGAEQRPLAARAGTVDTAGARPLTNRSPLLVAHSAPLLATGLPLPTLHRERRRRRLPLVAFVGQAGHHRPPCPGQE